MVPEPSSDSDGPVPLQTADVIIIGAGVAGAGLAHELAGDLQVLVLEAESQPGYHATGRSAALFSEIYGNGLVRALTRASRVFYEVPPEGFPDALLTPRGCLFVASADTLPQLDDLAADADVAAATRRLAGAEARERVPILKPDAAVAALFEPASRDVDVNGLHQGYLRAAARAGVTVLGDAPAQAIVRTAAGWRVETPRGAFGAAWLVNAAGAWADVVARLAGVQAVGLTPMRRTAITIDAPPELETRGWPMVIAADESFYFKPDAGVLLVSPADETPTDPCDAQPEEEDVALAAWRFEEATGVEVRRIRSKWAGLRTFAPDRSPVVGEDPDAPGFLWLAGQGGYGFQTAPALSRLAAGLIRQGGVPSDLAAAGVTAAELAPGRFRA